MSPTPYRKNAVDALLYKLAELIDVAVETLEFLLKEEKEAKARRKDLQTAKGRADGY